MRLAEYCRKGGFMNISETESKKPEINDNRILSIYTRLMNGGLIRKSEEAELFRVKEKSIQRDLDCIRKYLDWQETTGGPRNYLVYDRRQKAYRLEKDESHKLTNEETLAVCKILLDSRAFVKKEMMSILDRLIANCAPKKEQRLVRNLLSNEMFHYIEPHHQKSFLKGLLVIGKAIQENRVIQIQYRRLKEMALVERRIEPLAIMFSEFYFYLVGFIEGIDKEKEFENADDPFPTIYRIDRIEKLKVTKEHFRIPYADRFEEGEFRKRIQFMQGGRLQKITFEYSGKSIEAVLDRLPTAEVLSEKDGVYIVRAEVFGKGIDMWIRSQGEAINVLQRAER